MSFYCGNYHQENCPGPVSGNPLSGICEKTCIQVKKVFDASIKQYTLEDETITLDASAITPTTVFVSAKSSTSRGVITNPIVDSLDTCDCNNLSRVRADVTIPLTVNLTDTSTGTDTSVATSMTIHEDIIMCLPEPSIIPYELEAVVSCVIPDGSITNNQLVADVCVTIILKVVIEVELLVPSYGYCPIPPAQDYGQEVCAGFFELPLFPKTPCCKK